MSRPPALKIAVLLSLAVLAALLVSACGNAGSQSVASVPSTSSASTSSARTSPPTTSSSTTTTSSSTPALPGTGKPAITVGDKNYTEQFVLGQLYLQALQAQGYNVSLNQNIGPTAVTVQALDAGSLSIYPEYLDVFDSVVAGYKHVFGTEAGAQAAGEDYALAHGLALLEPTPFSDTQGIAVTDAYAADNHLHGIGDLRRVAASLTIAGPPQFQQGSPGLPELSSAYGVVPAAFKAMAVGDQYAALNVAAVQAADVNTTDGELATGDYVVLRDPHHVFGYGNVVPVVSAKAMLAEGPAFAETVQRVDSKLSTQAIRQMNEAVDIAQQDPASVAKQFLQTHGLLTPLAP